MDDRPGNFYVTVRYWVNKDGTPSRVSLAGAFGSFLSEASAKHWARLSGGGKPPRLRYEVWTLAGDQMAGLMLLGYKRGAIFWAKCEELGIRP